MKRFQLAFLFLIFLPTLASAQLFKESAEPDSNQSVVYIGSYDWGACVEKIVVNAGHLVSPQSIRAKDFEVSRVLFPKSTNIGVVKGELSVTDAFSSDSKGNKVAAPSPFITILTDVHPEAENSNPFVSLTLGSFRDYYSYKIENDSLDISIKKLKGFVNTVATRFSTGTFSYTFPASEEEKQNPKYREENITLSFASYFPVDSESKKIPLILWLHGLSEGGTNPYTVLFGTKASALADEKIQSYFENGAAILAPQSKTSWLESTEKGPGGGRVWTPVDKDAPVNKIKKPIENFLSKIFVNEGEAKPQKEKLPFAAVSRYTEPVKALLEEFLKNHPEIDTSRIYIGGCSAGGYMTMNMLIQYPDFFAAAFPICEYYLDSKITDTQIQSLAKKPLWFTYALNDDMVRPEKNSLATINRLKKAGAANLHSSEFRNVVDMSGLYLRNRSAKPNDEEFGLPYEYEGHYSWIYALNDQCTDGEESLFAWLSKQKR